MKDLIVVSTLLIALFLIYKTTTFSSNFEKVNVRIISDNSFSDTTVVLSIKKNTYSIGDTLYAQTDKNSSHWYIPRVNTQKDTTFIKEDKVFFVKKTVILNKHKD